MMYATICFPVPVKQITMDGINPMVVHEGKTKTIMCTTSSSRPAASVVWYNDMDNITSDARADVINQTGDTYITKSYVTLTGNKDDNGKLIKCEGSNGNAVKVTDTTTLDIWCK